MAQPTLQELIEEAISSRLLDLHTAMPARVLKFDDAAGTVDVLPVVKRRVPASEGDTVAEELPPIMGVKVAWQGSASCYIKFQIPKDSHVLLVFNEACIAQWRDTGQVSEPGDLERHGLSYPYAIPCAWPDSEEPGAVGAFMEIVAPGLKLNEVEIDGSANLQTAGEVTAMTGAGGVTLSQHLIPSPFGPLGPPTPGT